MRETKSFFVEGNKLNKGYSEENNKSYDKQDMLREKLQRDLPPLDVMEEYEAMYPGTFKKMLELWEKEQEYRFDLEQVNMKIQQKANFIGKIFGFFVICVIGFVILELARINEIMAASIFSVCAFSCIMFVSYISYNASDKRNFRDRRNFHKKDHSVNRHQKHFKKRRPSK
jgi:uncharacterized membrane protein